MGNRSSRILPLYWNDNTTNQRSSTNTNEGINSGGDGGHLLFDESAVNDETVNLTSDSNNENLNQDIITTNTTTPPLTNTDLTTNGGGGGGEIQIENTGIGNNVIISNLLGFNSSISRRNRRNIPKIKKMSTVKCHVNIQKETLKLIPCSCAHTLTSKSPSSSITNTDIPVLPNDSSAELNSSTLYKIQFKFDSTVECQIKIYFVAREKRKDSKIT